MFRAADDRRAGAFGEYIDISGEDAFQIWQKRAGLRCLVCGHPVEVYHSSGRNPFIRHGKDHGPKGTAAQGRAARETFLHYRFKPSSTPPASTRWCG